MKINLIAAVASNGVIGNQGDLPWRIPEELAFFNRMTKHGVLIVGRKTATQVQHRKAVVVSRKNDTGEMHTYVDNITSALEIAKTYNTDIWIAGGQLVYNYFIEKVDNIFISHIKGDYIGDTYFPSFSPEFYIRDELIYHPEFTTINYKKPEFKKYYTENTKVIINTLQGVYTSCKIKDIHAEQMLFDAEPDVEHIHMNALPCDTCAKLLARLPLLKSVTVHHMPNMGVSDMWKSKQAWAKIFLKQEGINLIELHYPKNTA
jgi:dihydrofolate reductase